LQRATVNYAMRQSTTPTFVDPFADKHDADEHDADRFYALPAAAEAVAKSAPPATQRFHLISYLIGLLTALLLVGGMDLLLRHPDPPAIVLQSPPTSIPTTTPEPTATALPMVIFVSGAVQQPGMYALDHNARVGDALVAAGGLTLQANVPLVNQAERLWDGAQVHVPFVAPPSTGAETGALGETAPAAPAVVQSAVQPTAVVPVAGISGSTSAPIGQSIVPQANGNLININRASPSELEALPGIGTSKAAAIVANRPYGTIDDLERVPGIGPKTVAQLRPLVTVE